MLSAICVVAIMNRAEPFTQWGLEACEKIRATYRLPNGLYADALEDGKQDHPAFDWGVGVWMSALNAAAKADPKWKDELRSFVEGSRVYWNEKGPVPGYDVLPGPKDVDRYYDDNQWMVMALVDASDVLKDKKYLGWAEETLHYVLSGEDDKLGGGIYWHETEKNGKNTCSNGPAAAACLAVYRKTKKPEYLEKAKELYAWTKKTLQDPADKLFYDGINLNGRINKMKWSYNTALMIRTAAELADLTKEASYANDAEEMATASEKKWIDPETGAFRDEGRFAHLLIESWNYVPNASRKEKVRKALNWLHEHGQDAQGRYSKRFDGAPKPEQTKFELIDQAAVARAYLVAP